MASASAGSGPKRPVDPVALNRTRLRLERADSAPWLHQEAARRMAERLPLFRQPPRRIIDWWTHAGGSAAILRKTLPQAVVEERSSRAAEAAKAPGWWRRLWPGRPTMDPGNPGSSPASADLVWANMLMHHVADPIDLMRQWHQMLKQDGFLMFSTLGPGSLTSLQSLYRRQTWGPPMADLVDMHDIGDMLVEAGFADPVMDQEIVQLTWSSPEAALEELRTVGANLHPNRIKGLRTPQWRQRLIDGFRREAERQRSDRITLEFEIVYGHAVKPPPRHSMAAETRIDIHDMRQSLKRSRNDR